MFALGIVTILGSGCAAGISSTAHGRGAGEWNVTLPATSSYAQGLAYGRGGSSARAQSDADLPLLAEAHTSRPELASDAAKKKHTPRKRRAESQPPANTTPAAPQPASPEPASAPPRQVERTELALADTGTLGRYEARQAQSQSQQAFRGGDAIVIGASTLVIVLLIVLLILLLL